jgi:hypothetical protein
MIKPSHRRWRVSDDAARPSLTPAVAVFVLVEICTAAAAVFFALLGA